MKNVIWVLLLISFTTFSQININVGKDLTTRKGSEVDLSVDVQYDRTLLDSIVDMNIPIVLLDTNDLHFGDQNQYHHDIIHIIDYVNQYEPFPFAILVQSPPKEKNTDVVISVSGDILHNGNYRRMVIKLEHFKNRELLGDDFWGHNYGDYEVNPPTENKIVPGDYVLFLTGRGTEWDLMTGVTVTHDIFSDNIYYSWSTGHTTKHITITATRDSVISVEVNKEGGKKVKDNVIITTQ